MASSHGVQLGVYNNGAPAVGYTGSSSEYWALAAIQQAEYQAAQQEEKRQARLRRAQRYWTIFYNVLTVGELVYFLVGLYMVQWQVADLVDNPLLGPGNVGVVNLGGTDTQRIVDKYQYWRLLTTLFYNAGAIHLTANLGMTWTFGHFLVREFSPFIVVFIWFAAGLAGVIFSANIGSENRTAGASAPAFALAGAATLMLVVRWRKYTWHIASCVVVCLIVGVNAFVGATPFVDNSGNTAAFVFGGVLCLGFLLIRRRQADGKGRECLVYGSAVVAVLVVLAAIIGGLVGLWLDTPIGGCCNVWVCTPSSWWDCDASRIWPTECTYTSYINGTAVLTCPRGQAIVIGFVNGTAAVEQVTQWCSSYCDITGLPGSGGSAGGVSGGGSGGGGGGTSGGVLRLR
ncbi:hypothetical protein HXX76_004123 [Chlamydomonas incerta]|uniref:RHOMBOID-like protein n=1 Tax=Chlamydomonas incerta TaxID=51695 RepID=A0A835W8N2_CHLIN|nr:hypothetical protein HXX76_004123 [Chlamydomonas incerta]|eukprot:KAG2440006.1 hypothetical protein HXX76_004123 [Chlamydomonas incerta]